MNKIKRVLARLNPKLPGVKEAKALIALGIPPDKFYDEKHDIIYKMVSPGMYKDESKLNG